jgi:L-histidine N-alpha-methyltransferase
MNYSSEEIILQNRISITNLLPEIGPEEVIGELITGLRAEQKYIASKYFYNERGSLLFEEITRLEEYYPTRAEKQVLRRIAPALMRNCKGYEIVELGPGDHSKVSILLSAAGERDGEPVSYLPLDISQPALRSTAQRLVRDFPNLQIEGYALDFITQVELIRREQPSLVCFFGGTIGNFEWEDALELLRNISLQMKPGDALLLGMDLVKPRQVLHAAYNDARGVTAAFNRNILNNVNDLLETDFNPDDFEHHAFFKPELSRIEMHLLAKRDLWIHSVHLAEGIRLKKGESIHTENSHKYSLRHIREISEETGLHLKQIHKDERGWFAITQFEKTAKA